MNKQVEREGMGASMARSKEGRIEAPCVKVCDRKWERTPHHHKLVFPLAGQDILGFDTGWGMCIR